MLSMNLISASLRLVKLNPGASLYLFVRKALEQHAFPYYPTIVRLCERCVCSACASPVKQHWILSQDTTIDNAVDLRCRHGPLASVPKAAFTTLAMADSERRLEIRECIQPERCAEPAVQSDSG